MRHDAQLDARLFTGAWLYPFPLSPCLAHILTAWRWLEARIARRVPEACANFVSLNGLAVSCRAPQQGQSRWTDKQRIFFSSSPSSCEQKAGHSIQATPSGRRLNTGLASTPVWPSGPRQFHAACTLCQIGSSMLHCQTLPSIQANFALAPASDSTLSMNAGPCLANKSSSGPAASFPK